MKKKQLYVGVGYIVWGLICLAAVLLTVPFIPIRYGLKDGGTVVYDAMLYDVKKVQSIQADTLKGEMVDLAVQFTDSEIVVHSNYVDLCLTGDNGSSISFTEQALRT